VNPGYAFGQLAKAFATAREHHDPATRERAETRVEQWTAVLRGMAAGSLRVGSRTPVDDLPAWATPQVVRGGFATGQAAAEGSLEPDELALTARAGLSPTRQALFSFLLSEPGLAELDALVRSHELEVRIPEDAALPVLAWLVGHGDTHGAIDLADDLAPLAPRLRFLPRRADGAEPDSAIVFREPVGTAKQTLAARREHGQVATMHETLTVWNPFADKLLALWLDTADGPRVASSFPAGWRDRAASLIESYGTLSRAHQRATKHRNPKHNLGILLAATREAAAGRELDDRLRGLLQHAVDAMVEKRGRPGSPRHLALRRAQAAVAAIPMHHTLARVASARLAVLPQARGVRSIDALIGPVTAQEAGPSGVPAGTAMPPSVERTVRRTLEGTAEHLIVEGIVASAEVLAELVPQIAAATVSAAYPDPDLQVIMAANYAAFRRRRSLLLLDLEHQVRVEELPWVRAAARHRTATEDTLEGSRAALVRLGELALTAFPATILPSPLVTELDTLAREAGLDLPFVEELAADIFMGRFSAKFPRAARYAGELLKDSLYARYYAIDYDAVRAPGGFDDLCTARADRDADDRWSVAANGTVIEQAQILTTHNLAVLTGPFGIGDAMRLDWDALASRCLEAVIVLAGRLRRNPRPLRTVKDAAYAWRQMLFFLSRLPAAKQQTFAARAREALAASRPDVQERMGPAVEGLATVAAGASFDPDGRAGQGRRLLGWTIHPHWMLGDREGDRR